jgi:molybdenum cofactor synthesis domain-containing protein
MTTQNQPPIHTEPQDVTAGMVVIGDEILSGRTKDQNIGLVAERLTAIGIRLREVRVVADKQADIISAINALRTTYDYVFTTGGIGPTHDDITADAVAAAFGVGIDIDPRALAIMQAHYGEGQLSPARLRMCRLPHGADPIANSISVAPGFCMANVFVMAGIPKVMQAMLDTITPQLRTGARLLSRTIRVYGREGDIATLLEDTERQFAGVSVGSYPFFEDGVYGTHAVLRSTDAERLDTAAQSLADELSGAGVRYDPPRT